MPRPKDGPAPSRYSRTIRIASDQPLYREILGAGMSIAPPQQHRSTTLLPVPDSFLIRGVLAALRVRRLGLICSVRMKGTLIVAMYDYARTLGPGDGVVVGGFHSPMERQVLELLIARRVPVIVVPARSPERMRIPPAWQGPLGEGRLAIVSGTAGGARRVTRAAALRRNLLVAALADEVLIPYATPGGSAEAVAQAVVRCGKRLLTFEDDENRELFRIGAAAVSRKEPLPASEVCR